MERPLKRTKFLSDSEGSDEESPAGNGMALPQKQQNGFSINKEYARRFEHNKKREEQHRLEEKYNNDNDDAEEESSSDESEDDDAELITDDLDNEIMSTLQAIKSKDPRVYDKSMKFYRDIESEPDAVGSEKTKEKPMSLHDYHRQNLLAGYTGVEDNETVSKPTPTYNEEQEALRSEMVGQMHAIVENEDVDSDEDGFKPKSKGSHEDLPPIKKRQITEAEVAAADKDPETFLSNFMASQAWRPTTDTNRAHAFDSDDSEDEARADAFEHAYNLRFEDPAFANEKLQSFARDTGKYSVRRDKVNARQKGREREREKKDEAKQERDEERARLRKLKIDEAEERLKKIKQAAGLRGEDVNVKVWKDVIDGDFDDQTWDREMQKRFGEEYYAHEDLGAESGDELAEQHAAKKRKKAKKPSWEDDIDIRDLVPDFDEADKANYTISDDEAEDNGGTPLADDATTEPANEQKKKKKPKDRKQEKQEAKRQARLERRAIEDIVDASLPISTAAPVGFRYRDTSPTSFGLNPRDILFATDAQLNQYAGLKKLAAYRDEGRKEKDRKKLGKKARLREWRKEVFGSAQGVSETAELGQSGVSSRRKHNLARATNGEAADGESKKKRSKKRKAENPSV